MSESAKPPVGETLALLLETPDCPGSVRAAVINHLSELYEQSNLMHPTIVRILYPVLQKQGAEAKAEHQSPKAAGAPMPFPLSVAQPQPIAQPAQPGAPPPSIFNQPSQPTPPSVAVPANPFANRGAAAPNSQNS